MEAALEIVEVYCLGRMILYLQSQVAQVPGVASSLTVDDAYLYGLVCRGIQHCSPMRGRV